eukprot:COSAG02_NODE_4607_length_5172_cov_2.482555_8_plen_133_part_00
MRVVKTANNLPTMFVLERVESDPEYDQLKAELYDLGDYVSMRYLVVVSSLHPFLFVAMLRCPEQSILTRLVPIVMVQYQYVYGSAFVWKRCRRPLVRVHAQIDHNHLASSAGLVAALAALSNKAGVESCWNE